MIICVEGIDGAGKTTHVEWLRKELPARVWKFPDKASPTGKLIYSNLRGEWSVQFSSVAKFASVPMALTSHEMGLANALVFQCLQTINRLEVSGEIAYIADKGVHVVLDRYWPSAFAYGGIEGLNEAYLTGINQWQPQPDLYLLLDIDFEQSLERRPVRRDRYEDADSSGDFLDRVARQYRKLWLSQRQKNPLAWAIVDARGSVEDTTRQVQRAVRLFQASL